MSPNPNAAAVDPHLTHDVAVDRALGARLVAIGSAFDAAPRSVVPEMHATARPRTRRVIRALTVVALSGALAGGAILATRPKTDDPIVGVIPKNLNIDDIETITETPDDGGQRSVELLTVDGADVIVYSTGESSSDVRWDLPKSDETELTVGGHRVFISSFGGLAGTGDPALTTARWRGLDKRAQEAQVRLDRQNGEPVLRRAIERSLRSSGVPGVSRVARWTESASGTVVVVGRSDRVLTKDGNFQGGSRNPTSVHAVESSIPNSLVERTGRIMRPFLRPAGGESFRFDKFLVTRIGPGGQAVRALRRSELRRMTKRVDRNHAVAIDPALWKTVARGFEVGSMGRVTCVRSRADEACGQYDLSRLVGKQWVFTTLGTVVAVEANGRAIGGYGYSGVNEQTIFLIPSRAQTIQVSYSSDHGQRFTTTISRPDI